MEGPCLLLPAMHKGKNISNMEEACICI